MQHESAFEEREELVNGYLRNLVSVLVFLTLLRDITSAQKHCACLEHHVNFVCCTQSLLLIHVEKCGE